MMLQDVAVDADAGAEGNAEAFTVAFVVVADVWADNDTNATNGNVVVKKDVDVEGQLAFELGTSMSR